jgi:hypothetical protein
MILHLFLEGEALKTVLSVEEEFLDKHLNERPISEYVKSAKPFDLSKDLHRVEVVAVTNFHNKENQSLAYFYGKLKEEYFSKALTGEDFDFMTKDIVTFSSSDPLWQAYLNSELYQAGILMLAEAMMKNPPFVTIGKFAELVNSNDYKQLSTNLETPINCTTEARILTNLDGSLEFHSKCLFSDHKIDTSAPIMSTHKIPSFLAFAKLKIVLIDNPNAKNDDPPEIRKMISITPRLDLYVMPGKEDFVKDTYSGFIEQFNSEWVPIDSVPNDPYINFIGMFDEGTAIKYIHDELHKILFTGNSALVERFRNMEHIATLFRSYNERAFHDALNFKDLANGNTLLHYAYQASDPKIAHHLLLLGAETNIPNNSGHTFESLWNSPRNATIWSIIPSVQQIRTEINDILKLRNYSNDSLNVEDFEIINTPPISEPDSQGESSESSPKAESPASISTSRLDWLRMRGMRDLLMGNRFVQSGKQKEKGKEEEKEEVKEDDKLSPPSRRND